MLRDDFSERINRVIRGFAVLIFIGENRNLFTFNRDIHSFNTRNSFDLHLQPTHLTVVQRGVLHSGCRVFNNLPAHIKVNLRL